MPSDVDRYERYYADKLWLLLPAIYRTLDTESLDQKGPLRELVNRIGAQAAVVRRGIDRLWEDQSIEACDDWVIPYIADLFATNLVASLDARGQRLDTAKTIYYRRRKGTVGILEEIASDITGWDAKIVEFFRRIGRTRHALDPEIGPSTGTQFPDELQRAEGLVGATTRTSVGGWADLRNAYGASKACSAFDEFFHFADFRAGAGMVGWHNIPRLGVFLWRLESFGVHQTMPVSVQGCPDHFTFDPTGRQIPLLAVAARTRQARFGDSWASPQEFQLAAPISQLLMDAYTPELYPAAAGVFRKPGSNYELVPADKVRIFPEVGRFKIMDGTLPPPFFGTYHYGFSSQIGAGPYDRRVIGVNLSPTPDPGANVSGGGAFNVTSPTGTTTIVDSLTYTSAANVSGIASVTARTLNKERPVIRLAGPAPWTFTGAAGSSLFLEGLFVSGADVVLAGLFDTVTLICCTLDPGEADPSVIPPFGKAVDGKNLVPTRVFVEGRIRNLEISRSIVGPIRVRGSGSVDAMSISDSIIQSIPDGGAGVNAIEEHSGKVRLNRCTVLGRVSVHRLDASESILNDLATVENTQDGCVRFSAWSTGSTLPRKYESLETAPAAPLFTNRMFGRPGYAQLMEAADQARISGAPSITQGAQDGSEMGAFCREKTAIKQRSLQIKYDEFMPLGLVPVMVNVGYEPSPGR
jgi:hypothetical protein